ncbi:hypothetical protein Tco_1083201 [Tanacetum coccineum]
MDDLLQAVPKLISRIDSLETDLKQTKLTMGHAIVKLVKKVKKLEGFLKRRNLVLSDSEEEESEAQGRKSQDDPLDSSVQGLPNSLQGAYLSQCPNDKGRRYKEKKETKGKKVVSSLDFQEEVNTAEGVNTGISTVGAKRSTPSPDKGQRAGKAPMIIEETSKKIAEEEELNEQQKKRRAQVQFEAQHYTDEDWDLIRAKTEANAELSKSMLGSNLQGEDFAKKMVDLVESFAPMNLEATKASLKRFGEELQTKTMKRLKDDEAKDAEPTKNSDEVSEQDDSVTCTKTPINPVPVAMKSPSIATYKIIKQGGKKEAVQIVWEEGTDIVYGMDGPEDELEKVFWKYLKNMFEEPLSTNPIWSALVSGAPLNPLAIRSVAELSQNILIGSFIVGTIPSPKINLLIQTASIAASKAAMHSASVADIAVVLCLELF